MKHYGGRSLYRIRSLVGVKLEVCLGEAGSEDGCSDAVLAAQAHTSAQEIVSGSLKKELFYSFYIFGT